MPAGTPPLSDSSRDPWEIVRASELAASPVERADLGAWYTPRPVAQELARRAFGRDVPRFVVDPTCGGGAFLLASLDELVARGVRAEDAVERIGGLDIDERAVATAREVVARWALSHGVMDCQPSVHVGDALGQWPEGWQVPDVIVGNPPFASPLRASQARSSHDLPPAAVAFREHHRDRLGPYADLAAIHLLNAALRLDTELGRLAMVLPQSMLSSRDTAPLQRWLAEELPIESLWVSLERHFDANVRVFAPVLARGADAAGAVGDWAGAAASAMGVPEVALPISNNVLGSMCTATAGFRDEYYGMAEACVEGVSDDARPRLATVGALDPLELLWGKTPTRFAKTKWQRPVVDEARVPPKVLGWFQRQRRPKVLLPTQARILEPFVDRTGSVIPITPVLSIGAEVDDLDRIAAVLLSPPVAAWAARRSAGAALSASAIKLRAADVLDIPLPTDVEAWTEAAGLVGQGPPAVGRIAGIMNDAYSAGAEVLDWWEERRR